MTDHTHLKTSVTDTTISTTTTTNTESRQQQLTRWLQQVFAGQDFTLTSLPGDASARQYHRVHLSAQDTAGERRYIVMDSADEQEALQQFISVAKLMAPVINVPTLVAQDTTKGFLVLQDFGTTEFAHLLVDADTYQVDDYYQQAMQTLVTLQTLPLSAAKTQYQLPDYDSALLRREMDLFSDWFLPYVGVELDQALWEELKSALVTEILCQPQVIVHRDYHSRNLMQDQADNSRLGVIDFQDAVVGAYTYDLVSLVRDAYVDWPEAQIAKWITDFWQRQQAAGVPTAESAEQFKNDVNVMGVQRHLKVLGIFIRLSERDGKDRYLADIPKVMRDLIVELNWLAKHGSEDIQQAVLPFSQWLDTRVLLAYQTKSHHYLS